MKVRYLLILIAMALLGCKAEKKEEDTVQEKETSILEKIAIAHGYDNWNKVEEIAFTFIVDRDSSHFERSWIWKPKTNEVTRISGLDTLTYDRKNMDSIAFKTNGGFINDRYWLLAPFNLMWDKDNFSYEHNVQVEAPISKEPMQKLTIVYDSEGGYTPGDAYDLYFGNDYLIREWVFRKANQPTPSMTTTWENYSNIEGLKLVKDHKKADENFNLYIDNITVVLEE